MEYCSLLSSNGLIISPVIGMTKKPADGDAACKTCSLSADCVSAAPVVRLAAALDICPADDVCVPDAAEEFDTDETADTAEEVLSIGTSSFIEFIPIHVAAPTHSMHTHSTAVKPSPLSLLFLS
jgi:hypothetical protein